MAATESTGSTDNTASTASTGTEDPETVVAELQRDITETRRKRMAAQKVLATQPVLETALERASRDRSTGATNETDALRAEIQELRDSIVHEVRQIDRTRMLFPLADAAYPGLPQRPRLISELNAEASWRRGVIAGQDTADLLASASDVRIVLPTLEDLV
ncbi:MULTISPECIES: hypothetical protein [Microbacterium]|uniref:Uncharacterized protein n=1 Tax=Microbacterium wangchenii TaxID=2541726 RepID=A0ABX5SXW7_9MICO|nr:MULTISPECIES: hypothetical protein [Microbacterium]MCK6065769.1 hypothetical protein [Microbacterium sp. EYE_512]QBR90085.1 hypothetical protein E4K62_16185 [Microbacterium wangchenii]